MGKNFLLDAEALTFTRDLLSYYLKKVYSGSTSVLRDFPGFEIMCRFFWKIGS